MEQDWVSWICPLIRQSSGWVSGPIPGAGPRECHDGQLNTAERGEESLCLGESLEVVLARSLWIVKRQPVQNPVHCLGDALWLGFRAPMDGILTPHLSVTINQSQTELLQ